MALQKKHISLATLGVLIIGIATIGWLTISSKPEPAPVASLSVAEKKDRFKKLIVPAVDDVYEALLKQYENTKKEVATNPDSKRLQKLRDEYRAKDNQQLLAAIKPHPRSIAIAQAAMESSWATSRFTREANNIFGVWSFDESEPRIAAGEQRGDKTIWVKKYASIEASVKDYYRILARGDAFKEFRTLKLTTDDPLKLVTKLDRYSEKGTLYGEELTAIIQYNKFTQYDQ